MNFDETGAAYFISVIAVIYIRWRWSW